MRKSTLIAIILLCVGCQNKQVSENAPVKPAEPVVETNNIADTTKDTLPEANSPQAQESAPSESPVNEESKEDKCGEHQRLLGGECVCGYEKLSLKEAVNWECVNGDFVCKREEGCILIKKIATVLNPPKDSIKSGKSDDKKDKAPVESTDTDKCKDVACGVNQTCEEGMCSCGGVKLSAQDAATWECVDERFRCYRKEGCTITKELSTVLTVLDTYGFTHEHDTTSEIITAKPYKKLIPIDPNAKYPDMPKRKPELYQEPDFDDSMNVHYSDSDYCDGAPCDYEDHFCLFDICFEEPGVDFESGSACTQGDGTGCPEVGSWVCNDINGCETKYGNYTLGDEFELGSSFQGLTLDSFFEKVTDEYPSFEDCFEGESLSELYNRHFEIKNQYRCNHKKQFVCQVDKCCCGQGECSKGEICSDDGECIIPNTKQKAESGNETDSEQNKESVNKYKPTPKACGIYAKQKKLKRGEFRIDIDKMCLSSQGCKCGDTICSKSSECHDGKCICAGVESPGEGYECKQWKWKCTDPEICPPKKLYKQPKCGKNDRIGDGYICRAIEDPDVPVPNYHNVYVDDHSDDFFRYQWQCALSDGCKCGKTQCNIGESCINGECFCGRKRALAAPGWVCTTNHSHDTISKLVCTQDEGCDCFGNIRKKGEYCYLEENLFKTGINDNTQECKDIHCPEGANCINGQCIFYSSPQKIDNPGEYVSNWGFPQCNMEEGCTCGESQCKKDEYCHQNACMKIPTSIEVNGQMIEFVTFEYSSGKVLPGYNKKSTYPYNFTRPKSYSETINKSGVDFIRQYGFERYYRTQHKDTCRGIPYPKNASGYVCLVGLKQWTSSYNESHHPSAYRYLPDEMLWMCNQEEGCACGKTKCKYQQTCINKCYDIENPDETDESDDNDAKDDLLNENALNAQHNEELDDNGNDNDYDDGDDEHDYSFRAVVKDYDACMEKEGCSCGHTWCYEDGKCYYNEFCYYDEEYRHYSCWGSDNAYVKTNDNGTCTDGKYLYAPDIYYKDADLGLKCDRDKCPCGEIQCDKNQYCVEPGRCI